MTPTEDGADVRCFFQILQYNPEYKNNFVFGVGTREDKLVKRDGRWLFYSLYVNAWTSADEIPWKGARPPAKGPNKTKPASNS